MASWYTLIFLFSILIAIRVLIPNSTTWYKMGDILIKCILMISCGVLAPCYLAAQPVTTSKIEIRRGFESGERLDFKIKYLGLTGGYATISAKPLDKNRIEFKLTARTAPWVENIYRLRIAMISETLLETYQTIRYTEDKKERDRVYYNVQDFNLREKTYDFSYLKNNVLQTQTINYGNPPEGEPLEGGLSVIAAFFFSRTLSLEGNTNVYTNCFLREKQFKIGIEPVGEKRIKSNFGRRETVVIRPLLNGGKIISDQRDMLIYLSNDELRIPLRVDIFTDFGPLRVSLIGYGSTPPD